MIGFVFAAASGILLAPLVGLDAVLLTLPLVLAGAGAAAVGLFSSLPMTYAGGLVIGVIAYVGRKYASDVPVLSTAFSGDPLTISTTADAFHPPASA